VAAKNKTEAKKLISELDIKPYIDKALEHGTLSSSDSAQAMDDYRHFLLLLWLNITLSNGEFIVPTERADAIWHEHILFTKEYREFCNALVGHFVDHVPGLEKGSEPFNKAVEHTRSVNRDYGSDGFTPMYLASCGGISTNKTTSQTDNASPDVSHDSSPLSGASNCSAGCGGGCGG